MEPDTQAIPENIEDFIGSAIDEAEATPEPAPEPTPEPETQELTPTDESTDEPVDEPNPGDEPEPDEPDEPEPVEEQTISAPQSMSAKDREDFDKLPPESQAWLTEREKQLTSLMTKTTMEVAEQRKSFDRLEQVIAPRRQQLAMNGMDDSTAIGQLFALSDFAERDPVEFARYLFNQRNIPLSALNEPGQTQASPELAELRSQVQTMQQTTQNQQRQQQDIELGNISNVIADFSKENPYYAELESEMIPIISALRTSQPGQPHKDYLAKAYKMAIATNDGVSSKVAADNKAKTEVARIAKAKKDAAAAKKAAGTNIKSSGTSPAGKATAKDVDSFIAGLVDERMTA